MCLGGRGASKTADQYYEEMRVEPEPLPELPTSGEKVERRQRRGMRDKPLGQQPRTLLNIGSNNG
jgi:hypothetical protein